jgi:hypothetical protein
MKLLAEHPYAVLAKTSTTGHQEFFTGKSGYNF